MAEAVAGNERILMVLHELSTQTQACGVRELASRLGASRSTVNRVLTSLTDRAIAVSGPQGAYTAGPRLKVLAAALHARHPMVSAAPHIIARLSDETNSTALLAVHDAPRPRVVVVSTHRHLGPMKYLLEPGTIVPLHAGATGRSILGTVGIAALGEDDLELRTPDTIIDRDQIALLLENDRKAGHTISVGQQFPQAAGAAAPFSAMGLNGSISITRPRFDTTDEDLERFASMSAEAAQKVEDTGKAAESAPNSSPIEEPAGSTAADRVIRLITALVTQPTGLKMGRTFAQRIRANRATSERLVASALSSGLAAASHDHLLPGPRLLHWAACLGRTADITELAADILDEASERTGETVGLTQLDETGRQAHMITVVDGARPLHYGLASGVPVPLHAGAAGKAILAHCPSQVVEELPLDTLTERTMTDRQTLAEDLKTIRERGWATGDGERIPDAFGVSAPYFIGDTVAGSITATVSRSALPELDVDSLASAIVEAANKLTLRLTV